MTIECTTVDFARMLVSIPQAVGTIAILTATVILGVIIGVVSIPQAVGTIAIVACSSIKSPLSSKFQYRKR